MPTFDPRARIRYVAPHLLVGAIGLAALGLGWRMVSTELGKPHISSSPKPLDAAAIAALQVEAFAQAQTQPGFAAPITVPVKVLPGETFEAAVRRVGVAPNEAHQVVGALAQAFDTVNIKAGMAFDAAIARPRDQRGAVRLIGLSMRTGPASALTLSRTFDGALRLREMEEKVHDDTHVAEGSMNGSLYESAEAAGATPAITADVVKLFSHKLDFSRDIHPGDEFRMVFDRKVTNWAAPWTPATCSMPRSAPRAR